MKNVLLILLTILSASILNAQKVWIKGNVEIGEDRFLTLGNPADYRNSLVIIPDKSGVLTPSLSVLWVPNAKKQWEFGAWFRSYNAERFVGVYIQNDSTVVRPLGDFRSKSVGAFMEYAQNLKPSCTGKTNIYAGFFTDVHVSNANVASTYRSEDFPLERTIIGGRLGVLGKFQYLLGERLMLEFSTRINLGNVSIDQSRIENPALTLAQQKSSILDVSMFGGHQLRCAVAWRLGKTRNK
jgi:hypothetical protein